MSPEVRNYADSLYEQLSFESLRQLEAERREFSAKRAAQRSPEYQVFSGIDIQNAVQFYAKHIERCMALRLESYQRAYAEFSLSPTEEDLRDIMSTCQDLRQSESRKALAAVQRFIGTLGGSSRLPAGAVPNLETVLVSSSHGHDRVLRDWKIWRDKTRLSNALAVQHARKESTAENVGSTGVAKAARAKPLPRNAKAAPPAALKRYPPNRAEKIGIIGLIIAILALAAAWLTVPEFRRWVRLDKPSIPAPTPTAAAPKPDHSQPNQRTPVTTSVSTEVRRSQPAVEFDFESSSDKRQKLALSVIPSFIRLGPSRTDVSEAALPMDVSVDGGTITVLKFGKDEQSGFVLFDTTKIARGTRIRGEVDSYAELHPIDNKSSQ